MKKIQALLSTRFARIVLVILVLAAGSAYAYSVYGPQADSESGTQNEETQTAQARLGDITLIASGTGVVVPYLEVGVFYEEGGTLNRIDVVLGDSVQAGETLVQILTENTVESLALEVALAEQAVADARDLIDEEQKDYNNVALPSSQADIDQLYADVVIRGQELERAQDRFEPLANRPTDDVQRAQAQSALSSAQEAYNTAVSYYNFAISNGSEIHQAVASADLKVAQATLAQAEVDLEDALAKSIYANLVAPIDGVVTEIAYGLGEKVGSSSIVKVADLSLTMLEVYMDEADLGNVAIGDQVEIIFDAYPDLIFTGSVLSIDPNLRTVQNVSTLVAMVEMDAGQTELALPIGMQAVVDVISGRAEGAVLVPVEALREIAPDEYVVFVVEDGEPRVRPVTVGLIDFTSAEIISGLELGEVVTTGLVETQ